MLLFLTTELALSFVDKLTGWNHFLHYVHVNMKPCSCMRHVQITGMPVTFNTGLFLQKSFYYFGVFVEDVSAYLTLLGSLPCSMPTIIAMA